MRIFFGFGVLNIVFAFMSSPTIAREVHLGVMVDLSNPVSEVRDEFISFAIDSSQLVGGFWWKSENPRPSNVKSSGGKGKYAIQPFDFERPKLRNLTQALAPAILRVGGTEADTIYYDLNESMRPLPKGYEHRLTRTQWDRLVEFTSDLGLELMFTLNAGPGPRGNSGGRWSPANAQRLLSYARTQRQSVPYWELGNEVNGFFYNYGLSKNISAKGYAQDYEEAKVLLRWYSRGSQLAGPASIFWPKIGEPVPFLSRILKGFLKYAHDVDMITWHYYPTQSERCPLKARAASIRSVLAERTRQEIDHWASKINEYRQRYQPEARLWMGEIAMAQCGGQPHLTNLFASSLLWLDQLGRLARMNHEVVIRQTLTGSDYGLIDYNDLHPNPDYWASLLWKKLMGRRAFLAKTQPGQDVEVYAHCTAREFAPGGVTLLAINFSPEPKSLVSNQFLDQRVLRFQVRSHHLLSRLVRLNGALLAESHEGIVPELGRYAIADHFSTIRLDPYSYEFFVFPDLNPEACF